MPIKTLCLAIALLPAATAVAQTPGNGLTPEQQHRFETAQKEFQAGNLSQALTDMRALLAESPYNRLLTLGTAETALDAEQATVALDLLKAYEAKHPDDWLAMTYEARAYAETKQPEKRDALIARLVSLHKTSTDPSLQKQTQFLAERVHTDKGRVDVYYSLVPWSRYNIYEMARLYDEKGQQTYRVTLESSDLDQTSWSKNHPDLAAKGMRVFTIDGYSNSTPNSNGTSTQTHATFGFLDGQPTYDAFKERALSIAKGKDGPMSTTSGIPVPK